MSFSLRHLPFRGQFWGPPLQLQFGFLALALLLLLQCNCKCYKHKKKQADLLSGLLLQKCSIHCYEKLPWSCNSVMWLSDYHQLWLRLRDSFKHGERSKCLLHPLGPLACIWPLKTSGILLSVKIFFVTSLVSKPSPYFLFLCTCSHVSVTSNSFVQLLTINVKFLFEDHAIFASWDILTTLRISFFSIMSPFWLDLKLEHAVGAVQQLY